MAEGISACIPMALRSVGDAIRLDSENRTKEAYCQYLSCIIYISKVLKDDAWDKDLRSVYNKDTAKLFQLLHQCQERALTIISTHASDPPSYQSCQAQRTNHLVAPAEGLQRRYSDSSLPDQQQLASPTDLALKLSKTSPPNIVLSSDKGLHLPSPPSSPMLIHDPLGSPVQIRQRTRSSDHLEKAYNENKQLILAYRTRIQNQVTGGRNQDVTSKNLSLLRRMSENLVIAEAREQALKKKILERQQRLKEETNRRFGPAVLSTKEEQEQRLVFTKILEFEQETVWPKHLRERLKLMPEDSQLIKEIITKIFRSSDHPLTQFLLQYQYHVYRKLAPLVKDVGFRDVNGDEKAENRVYKEVLEERRSDQQLMAANSGENEDSGIKDEGKSLRCVNGDESRIESEIETKAPLNIPENVNEGCADGLQECNKNVTCNVSERGGLDNQEGASGLRNHTENEKNGSMVDLKKLKALLDQESQVETVENDEEQNQNNKSNNAPNSSTGASSEFENYFRELEEDMLGWESSDSDNNSNEVMNNSDGILDLSKVEAEEKTVEVTNSQAEEELSPLHWTKGSEGVVEPVVSVEEHSSPALDETAAGDRQEINQVRESNEDLETEPESSPQVFSMKPSNLQESIAEDPNCAERVATPSDTSRCQSNNADIIETSESDDINGTQTPGSLLRGGNNTELHTAATEEVRSQLKNILVDIRFFLEKLQKLLMLAYEQLDTPAGRDLCYSCVEFPFFRPLWPMLLAVLRQVNYDKELCLADVMTENIKKKPEDLGVPQRLCLDDQKALDATSNTYPYQMAVEELHRVVTFFCPLEKLECIVRTSRCICQCVEDYWEIQGQPRHSSHTVIGCDDLLPILSYVVVRSGMAQLISECDAMEEFIPEGYLMGEEGYCLTTLLTALAYLATLKP